MISFSAVARSASAIGFCVLFSNLTAPASATDLSNIHLEEKGTSLITRANADAKPTYIYTFKSVSDDQASGAKSETSEIRQRWQQRLEAWRQKREELRAERKTRLSKKNTSGKTSKSAEGGLNGMIAKYAKQHGVPYNLARAVVQVESTFRPHVTGGAGEIGLMQIKLSTARGMGYKGSRKALYDPATNLYWGMKYLGKAHQLAAGSTCGTILRYNAGHGAKRMNPISSRYCGKVKRILS